MFKRMLFWATACAAASVLCSAKDYPLTFKTLSASEAMTFPGGAGRFGLIQLARPGQITKEPTAVSQHPLYGQLTGQHDTCAFRLDESKGDGQGYDRLIVDLNRNGDLTDDPSVGFAEASSRSTAGSFPQIALFGPIPAPPDKSIGAKRPIYFAQMYLYTRPAQSSGQRVGPSFLGQLRFRAGWYLETTVEANGHPEKIGIVDGDGNLRLGDPNTPTMFPPGVENSWYFQNGDYFLIDRNADGRFENSVGSAETAPCGSLLYLGSRPYGAKLTTDQKTLSLEPWGQPLAELKLQAHGQEVTRLQVGWERAPGQWQLLQPVIQNGKAQVPPGRYRLYACTLTAKTPAGESVIVSGYQRTLTEPIQAVVGAATDFKCGAPLVIQVDCRREGARQGASSLLGRIVQGLTGGGATANLRIQATVHGVGGATYSSFLVEGKNRQRQPPKPTFTITTRDGKQVASGNMEFG